MVAGCQSKRNCWHWRRNNFDCFNSDWSDERPPSSPWACVAKAIASWICEVAFSARLRYHKSGLLPASKSTMNNRLLFSLAVTLFLSFFALAQDPSLLRPPKGAPVAIVVFEDLQCPKCRVDSPLEEQAAKTHKVPLVRHDFPLPMHNWSYKAAILARYFDTHSRELGDQ